MLINNWYSGAFNKSTFEGGEGLIQKGAKLNYYGMQISYKTHHNNSYLPTSCVKPHCHKKNAIFVIEVLYSLTNYLSLLIFPVPLHQTSRVVSYIYFTNRFQKCIPPAKKKKRYRPKFVDLLYCFLFSYSCGSRHRVCMAFHQSQITFSFYLIRSSLWSKKNQLLVTFLNCL